jgi:HD superfamily phosphohydrolase
LSNCRKCIANGKPESCKEAETSYDLKRLLVTLTISEHPETGAPLIAVEEGGLHAAEALIIARYLMFTQVYFHPAFRM